MKLSKDDAEIIGYEIGCKVKEWLDNHLEFIGEEIRQGVRQGTENSFPEDNKISKAIESGVAISFPFAEDITNAIYNAVEASMPSPLPIPREPAIGEQAYYEKYSRDGESE